jgi:hypothetical protein
MLPSTLALWLLCPITADAKPAPKGDHFFLLDYANLHARQTDWSALPVALREPPPDPLDLPLWDLDATLAELPDLHDPAAPEWAAWMHWTIARAEARPASAQAALIVALRSEQLSAARLAWWRSLAAPSVDDHDALLSAFDTASSPTTRYLLASALALTHHALSCPVALDLDGACRAPGTSMLDPVQALVRRDPIALESARRWTATADELRREAELEPDDLAAQALAAELELVSLSEDYEQLLTIRTPGDLQLRTDEWMRDSGVRELEQEYARQAKQVVRSRARLQAFWTTQHGCLQAQLDRQAALAQVDARLAVHLLLQQALLLRVDAELIDGVMSLYDRTGRSSTGIGERMSTFPASTVGIWPSCAWPSAPPTRSSPPASTPAGRCSTIAASSCAS